MTRGAVVAAVILATLVSPAWAVADSYSEMVVASLNAQRARNGIPATIQEVPAWSGDCLAHDQYYALNGRDPDNPHAEDPAKPGYSEAGDRAASRSNLGGTWSADRRDLNPYADAPLHLQSMLNPNVDRVGASPGSGCLRAGTAAELLDPPPTATPPTTPPVGAMYTYPGPDVTDVEPEMVAAEWPYTPGERVGIAQGTATGPYLYLFPVDFYDVSVTAATLTGPEGAVPVRAINPSEVHLLRGPVIIPLQGLRHGGRYTATVQLRDDDTYFGRVTTFTHTWSFTTRALDPEVQLEQTDDGELVVRSANLSPATITVTAPAGGAPLATLTATIDKPFQLPVRGGRYRVCAAQIAAGEHASAQACDEVTWRAAPNVSLGKAKRISGGRVRVPVRSDRGLRGTRVTVQTRGYKRVGRSLRPAQRMVTKRVTLRAGASFDFKRPSKRGSVRVTLTVPANRKALTRALTLRLIYPGR